jgi:hypothetical protein
LQHQAAALRTNAELVAARRDRTSALVLPHSGMLITDSRFLRRICHQSMVRRSVCLMIAAGQTK